VKLLDQLVPYSVLPAGVHCSPRCDISLTVDCDEIYKNISTKSSVYTIYPGITPVQVFCDMDTDGGKWTVIQRRMDGTVNFYRPWKQYKVGFGNGSGEYWLGLENMHLLTKKRRYELRVDMEDFGGNKVFAKYSSFSVGSEADGYKLHVSGLTNGGAGDSLLHHSRHKFSTFDKDQDTWRNNCASTYYGAFWYTACHSANINGVYLWGTTSHYATGVIWSSWKGYHYSLKAVAMKIRPVS
uniref:Microfibril associated protein 4 n=1 Tax=Myripristis murdjan TaxID=586833 RepID=A0A667YB55_9TELE